jgi:hypothetical protein
VSNCNERPASGGKHSNMRPEEYFN